MLKKGNRRIIFHLFLLLMMIGTSWAATETQLLNQSVSAESALPEVTTYVRLALKQNPAVKSAFHAWQEALKKTAATRGLPDPQVNFGYFMENIETAVGPQEWKIGFMQMIPWPGKLKVAGDIQSLKAEAARMKLQDTLWDVLYQVQTLYLDVYFLERRIAITQENLELVKQWEQVILTKFKAASASHPDLIKTQIEVLKLQDDLETLIEQRPALLAQFRAALNTDTIKTVRVPKSLAASDRNLNKEDIRNVVITNNPKLSALQTMQAAAEKMVTRAKLNWLPDFSVGVDYISTGNKWKDNQLVPESGKDPLVVMGSVSLPLWGYKQAAQVRASQEKSLAQEASVQNMENTLEAAFEKAWFTYENAERKWKLYQDQLLPKSLESLRATEKAYIGDQIELLSLVDAQRRYLDFTLASEKAKVDYYQSIAQLEKLAGRSL